MKCKSCGKPSCKGTCKTGAKKLSPKQTKIAGAAAPTNKITGADFKALKSGKAAKMTMNKKKGM